MSLDTRRVQEDDMSQENDNPSSSESDPMWYGHGSKTPKSLSIPYRTDARKTNACTRLVLMSDTHGKHRQVMLPRGDCLIHAGDFTRHLAERDRGDTGFECLFPRGYLSTSYLAAGNHDITLHPSYYHEHGHRSPSRRTTLGCASYS
jgi:hypothetical protein